MRARATFDVGQASDLAPAARSRGGQFHVRGALPFDRGRSQRTSRAKGELVPPLTRMRVLEISVFHPDALAALGLALAGPALVRPQGCAGRSDSSKIVAASTG